MDQNRIKKPETDPPVNSQLILDKCDKANKWNRNDLINKYQILTQSKFHILFKAFSTKNARQHNVRKTGMYKLNQIIISQNTQKNRLIMD